MSYYKYENMPWSERKSFAEDCIKRYIDTPYCALFILAGNDYMEEDDDNTMSAESESEQLAKAIVF